MNHLLFLISVLLLLSPEGGNLYLMGVRIFQYKESQLEEIRIILNEFLSFIANELNKPPWDFNLDVEHELDFTRSNI